MTQTTALSIVAIVALHCCAATISLAADQDAPATDLGGDVHAIFAAKCGECHSPGLVKPKGKLGYLLDVRRVASNPKLVSPTAPEQSKLWRQIESGDMPPEDAREGPLSDSQKAVVRWWIESGTPAPRSEIVMGGGPSASVAPPTRFFRRLLQWIGRFHVLVIHFPIALFVAAGLAEFWWAWRGRFGISPVVRYCVLLGAAGALASSVLGWMRAPFAGYSNAAFSALFLHRWLGTAAGTLAIMAAVASEYDVLRGRRTRVFQGILLSGVLIIGLAAHLGGTLVHGDDFLRW